MSTRFANRRGLLKPLKERLSGVDIGIPLDVDPNCGIPRLRTDVWLGSSGAPGRLVGKFWRPLG